MTRRSNLRALVVISIVLMASVSSSIAKVIYVDANAPGPIHDGSSWTDAYNYLQDALADANSAVKPVEIWVAEGIYTPDSNSADPNGSGDREATFQLINGVTIKGGYAGIREPDPNERDIEFYKTFLSGDLNGNDVVVDPCDLFDEPTRAENSYHIVFSQLTDASAVLDGFTITGGNANGTGGYPFFENGGGGLYNGIHMPGSPTLINCTFIENSTWDKGGGILNSGYFDDCSPTLTNCTFSRNWAKDGGGGMFNNGWYGTCSPKLSNCVFSCNSSSQFGGGLASTGAFCDVTLINCTFTNNSAGTGGGIFNPEETLTLTNCILWGDEPEEICGNAIVNYSCIEASWEGLGNIVADPCFADVNNGDYHLKSQAGRWDPNSESWVKDDVTSPCIDSGNPGCPVGDEPDPNGNRKNMGAYGGTAEASKSPGNGRSIADLTNDWIVDSNDLKVFVDYWLQMGECLPGDFDRSQFVDFNDFAILGGQWSQKGPGPGISYNIGGCIPVDFPSSTAEEPNETRFTVTVVGSNIHFEDMMRANCCPEELDVQMTLEDNLITIYEIERFFTRVPCPCICDFPITATFGPFEPGTYIFAVYQNNSFIGSTTVTIENGQ